VTSAPETRGNQYQVLPDAGADGLKRLGLMTSESWRRDPKHLVFVAQMLAGCERILEIECDDAFDTRIVWRQVSCLTAVEFDAVFIREAETQFPALDLRSFSARPARWPGAERVRRCLCARRARARRASENDTFLRAMLAPLDERGPRSSLQSTPARCHTRGATDR